jgi:sterol desaturase/sphingolipid hydroxylase (fatty acid hydroxylase superfamily)
MDLLYRAQLAAGLPVAWVAAQYSEGAYHRMTGHLDGALSHDLHRLHQTHHDDPVDASDGEYVRMLGAIAIALTIVIAARPSCPTYMRGALDATIAVAVVFPYVSWAMHAEYHNPNTTLDNVEWFRYLRARHRAHHSTGGVRNYGITSSTYDVVHGTEAEVPLSPQSPSPPPPRL